MFLVLIAIGAADVLFALLDSIPAVYGVTQYPYIVFWPTRSRCSGYEPCSSWSPDCSTD